MSISRFFVYASRSLRVRFLAALLLGAALVTAIGSYATYQVAQTHIRNQLVERSKLLASAINHSAMIASSDADLQHVVKAVLSDNPDIRTIAIMVKNDQKLIASASAGQTAFSANSEHHLWGELVGAIGVGKFGFHTKNNKNLVLIAPLWPVMKASAMHGEASGRTPARSPGNMMPKMHIEMGGAPKYGNENAAPGQRADKVKFDWITQNLSNSDTRGGILLLVDSSGVVAVMKNILWGLMPVSVVGVLAILALAYVLLHFQVISALSDIRHVMKRQQSGDRQARAETQSTLEFDEVAVTFNGMIDTISDGEEAIRQAERELTHHRDHLQELVDTATRELKDSAEDLKQALAKEQNLNKLQREFVSMASHEFRTPLAIIDATAQRMKRRAAKNQLTPEDAAHRITKIRDAVQRMTRLMESTLNAARMEEGKIEVTMAPCDIAKVVREICTRQQDLTQTHIISCNLDGLPASIQADTGSLEQMLTNLLSNAVKYAPDAPDIEVMARMEDDQVVISVRDQGIGIDQDDLSKIGERFFRARTSIGMEGTGIGLNLVRMLVELHDGAINVESAKGEGSTFTISLPIAGSDRSQRADTRAA